MNQRLPRDNLKKEIIATKKHFYHHKFDKCIGNSRQTFKPLNKRRGKNASEIFPILASCQKNIMETSQVDNANSFTKFFINFGSNFTIHQKKNTRPRLKSNVYSMFLYQTNLSEVQKIIQGLDRQQFIARGRQSQQCFNQNFWFGNSSILSLPD